MTPRLGLVAAVVGLIGAGLVVPTTASAVPVDERVPVLLADIETNRLGIKASELVVTDSAVFFAAPVTSDDGTLVSGLHRHDRSSGDTRTVFSDPDVTGISPHLAADDLLYFVARTDEYGSEPWVYDTASETVEMLADVNPGPGGSSANDFVSSDVVYFTAVDAAHGQEIWSTKGTPDSTELVDDLAPGPEWSYPKSLISAPVGFTSTALFFTAWSPDAGGELFRLDPGGEPTPVEVNVGASGATPLGLSLATDGALYFTAEPTGGGRKLFRLAKPAPLLEDDVLEELSLGFSTIELAVAGDTAFAKSGTTTDWSLWKVSGGSATPVVVVDEFSGSSLADGGGGLFFERHTEAGVELWVSDGTAEGTRREETVTRQVYEDPITTLRPGSLFVADDGGPTGAELRYTEGSPGTTTSIADIRPGRFGSDISEIYGGGDRWFFVANDGENGYQLWESDGTALGTRRLTTGGTEHGASSEPTDFTGVGDRTYFEVEQPDSASALWFHDRSSGEVAPVQPPSGVTLLSAQNPVAFGDRVMFVGDTVEYGPEPWISDGTPSGTKLLVDTRSGPDGGFVRDAVVVDDSLLFESEQKLWIVGPDDGTAAEFDDRDWQIVGAHQRKLLVRGCAPECGLYALDIDSSATTFLIPGVYPRATAEFEGDFYFADSTGLLYRTDGTVVGSELVPGLDGVSIQDVVPMGDQLLLQEQQQFADPRLGTLSLYVISPAGEVRPVVMPDLGFGQLDLFASATAGDRLYATSYPVGNDGVDDEEDVATWLVEITGDQLEVVFEFEDSVVTWIGAVDDEVYVMTSGLSDFGPMNLTGGEPGPTLWTTDGTMVGTAPVVDFEDSGVSNFYDATEIDGLLYGSGETDATGDEPFTFDLRPDPVDPVDPTDPTDPDAPSEIVSLEPARVFASRASDSTVDGLFEGGGRLPADSLVEIDITGRGGVAPTGVKAVVMNVTAINPSGRGYMTVYPCGDRPLASSLNYGAAGAVVGNELVAKLSDDGTVCVFTSAQTDLSVDVVGHVPTASGVISLDPARVYATRSTDETVDGLEEGVGRIDASSEVEIAIAGRAGVASSGAASVVMNITAINPSGRGYITVSPCGDRPLASSLNYGAAGAVVGNELIAKLSADGTVCVLSSAETDLTVDVVGYVPDSSAVTSLDPARVYATRASDETVDGEQEATGQIAAGEFVEVEIAGRADVPGTGVGAVVMNITAINPTGRGFITTYPCEDRPLASSLNYGAAGAVVGNELVAKLSADGTVCVYSSAATDLTVDVVGYIPA